KSMDPLNHPVAARVPVCAASGHCTAGVLSVERADVGRGLARRVADLYSGERIAEETENTMAGHRLTSETLETEAALQALLGEPSVLVCAKVSDRLNALTRPFIEQAPFLCLATADADGHCDVSPRGDPAGFVRILDDRTLLIP